MDIGAENNSVERVDHRPYTSRRCRLQILIVPAHVETTSKTLRAKRHLFQNTRKWN